MKHTGRQIIDANVSDLSLVDDPQDHIAFTLIEELRDRIVAKIDPYSAQDDLRNHALLFIEELFANRRFELVANWSIQ